MGMLIERTLIQPFRVGRDVGNDRDPGDLGHHPERRGAAVGAAPRPMPDIVTGTLAIGPFSFPWSRLVVIAAAALIFIVFWLFMQRTRLGRAMRAVAQDTETALIQGIRVNHIYPLAFGL